MINVATTFSGVGTPEIALKELGFNYKSIFAAEIDEYARATFLENSEKPETFYKDVSLIDGTKYLNKINLYIGGSPCQSFSIAGQRKGFEDTRGTLFFDFVRLISEAKPDVFIYENVKGIQSHDNGNTFKIVLESFSELGYFFKWKILNTKDYGIPQNRPRFYLVGFKNKKMCDKFEFKEPEELYLTWKDFVYYNTIVEDKYTLTLKNYLHFNRNFGTKGKDISNNKICPTLIASMGTGGGNVPYFYSPLKLNGETNYRKLTPRECFNLQGFNDDFKFPEKMSNSKLYKQAGNGMSLNILKMIFIKLREINAI